MIAPSSETREALTRAFIGLPSVQDCDAVLVAGRLPTDERCRSIFESELLRIQHEYRSRKTIQERAHLAKNFARISRRLEGLIEELQSEAGRHVIEVIKMSTLFMPFMDIPRYFEDTIYLYYQAMSYERLYNKCAKQPTREKKVLENWLFENLYLLYAKLKGKRPGNSERGPLFRFTDESSKLMGVQLTIDPGAFRKRMHDILNRWQKGVARLSAIPKNNWPVRMEPFSIQEALPPGAMRRPPTGLFDGC